MVHTRISGKRNYYSKLTTCTKFKECNSALIFQLQRETAPPSSNHQKLPNHFTVSTFTTSRRILFLYYIKKNRSLTSTFTSILFLSLYFYPNLCDTHPHNTSHITDVRNDNDIILMIYDKNMGWALVPTSWFSTEYKLHFSSLSTYRLIDNFNCKQTIMDSHTSWPTQKTILNYHHKP